MYVANNQNIRSTQIELKIKVKLIIMVEAIEINNLTAAVKKTLSARAVASMKACETAVILHLYYSDMWHEIEGYLDNLGSDFDLYISICDTAEESDVEQVKRRYPNAFLCRFENRGRDMSPFMEILPVIWSHYSYICKIHSKKSPHLVKGDVWRKNLYESLLGSPKRIAEIKGLLNHIVDVGIVGPEGQLLPCRYFLLGNEQKIIELAKQMETTVPDNFDYDFPAGSMFWFKPDALAPLLNLHIDQKCFETEENQLDATLAHALERAFPLAARVAGYETVDTHILVAINNIFGSDIESNTHNLVDPKIRSIIIRLAKSEARNAALDDLIAVIYGSTSWRITRPIRYVFNQLKLKVWLNPYLSHKLRKLLWHASGK